MTRVIAGTARGRRLAVPAGRSTRPTSDRAREGLFSALRSMAGDLTGARVLDLYAGSGAVGLEALSRGATHVLLVEAERRAAAICRTNVAAVGLPGAQVLAADAARLTAGPNRGEPYDVAFLDPPYGVPAAEVRQVLAALAAGGWLRPGAVVVVERSSRDVAWAWPEDFVADRARRYGEGTLWYGRAAGSDAAGHDHP